MPPQTSYGYILKEPTTLISLRPVSSYQRNCPSKLHPSSFARSHERKDSLQDQPPFLSSPLKSSLETSSRNKWTMLFLPTLPILHLERTLITPSLHCPLLSPTLGLDTGSIILLTTSPLLLRSFILGSALT